MHPHIHVKMTKNCLHNISLIIGCHKNSHHINNALKKILAANMTYIRIKWWMIYVIMEV